jgi:hypothetical protein
VAAEGPWPLPVGLRKFVLMSFFTMGLYDIYWFYWNWRRQRDRRDPSIHAGVLTFVSPVTAYVLLRDIRKEAGSAASWNAAALAIAYFALVMSFLASGWLWILTWLSFLPLIPVQQTINRMHEQSAHGESPDNRLTAVNIAGMAAGLLFMALFIAVALTIDEEMVREAERQMRILLPQK